MLLISIKIKWITHNTCQNQKNHQIVQFKMMMNHYRLKDLSLRSLQKTNVMKMMKLRIQMMIWLKKKTLWYMIPNSSKKGRCKKKRKRKKYPKTKGNSSCVIIRIFCSIAPSTRIELFTCQPVKVRHWYQLHQCTFIYVNMERAKKLSSLPIPFNWWSNKLIILREICKKLWKMMNWQIVWGSQEREGE